MRVVFGGLLALALGLLATGAASAQDQGVPNGANGVVVGEVDRCSNGAESPASNVAVGVQEGSASLTRTDTSGQFVLSLAEGQYTVIATADDGTGAARPYVPVAAGQVIDIGNLDLAAGIGGCGDAGIVAPAQVQPTATPVPPTATAEPPTATPEPPTATPVPTPQPEATPAGD